MTTKKAATLAIPDDLTFADLRLARDASGSISFAWPAIERICTASNLPVETFRASEDNVAGLIVGWYRAHRQLGGAPDAVAESLIEEVRIEESAGQTISYPPGRA